MKMITMNLTALIFMTMAVFNNVTYAMNHNTQKSIDQVRQQAFQQNMEYNNQRSVNNHVASGQPIPTNLISQMHPAAAAGAYMHNASVQQNTQFPRK